MVLSTGYSKVKTAVFISGTGSNLKSLIKFSKTDRSPISVEFIVSNNSKARGLKCERCWHYEVDIGDNSTHKTLCRRCINTLGRLL